jgi:hypothetical protein
MSAVVPLGQPLKVDEQQTVFPVQGSNQAPASGQQAFTQLHRGLGEQGDVHLPKMRLIKGMKSMWG